MSLFDKEIRAVRHLMMQVENADIDWSSDDPRNLDPDDDALDEMFVVTGHLEEAAESLHLAVGAEITRRAAVLDAMSEKEYEAWEKSVHG